MEKFLEIRHAGESPAGTLKAADFPKQKAAGSTKNWVVFLCRNQVPPVLANTTLVDS